jgi:hypothetical protein
MGGVPLTHWVADGVAATDGGLAMLIGAGAARGVKDITGESRLAQRARLAQVLRRIFSMPGMSPARQVKTWPRCVPCTGVTFII